MPATPGACCFADGTCQELTEEDCTTAGGASFQGDFTICAPNPCPQPTGACCFADGSCTVETTADCSTASGTYQGDGTGCTPNPCPQPTGACCFADGTCSVETAADCAATSGVYQGDDASCTPNPCPQPTGACCFADGSCTIETTADCATLSGIYQGDDASCTPNPCPQPTGACCAADGTCSVQTAGNCTTASGVYQGDDTTCTPNPCPQPTGACCFADGSCQELTEEDCTTAGGDSFLGDFTVCTPNPCPQPTGACCFTDGTCQELTEENCTTNGGAFFEGDLTVCSPNPCPQPTGACCFVDGSCSELVEEDCTAAGGAFAGDLTVCAPNPCPQPTGACCFTDGSCQELTEEDCTAAGGSSFEGDLTVCTPNPCPQPTGACCFTDGTCQELTEEDCTAAGGASFEGDLTACTPNPCPQPPGACCFTDGSCQELTEEDCTTAGGDSFLGDLTVCNPNPCPQPPGACCFDDGTCQSVTEEVCDGDSGIFQGDFSTCDPNPCPQPMGACCFTNGSCSIRTQPNCENASGTYQGDDTVCDPNPCPQPTGACCFVDGTCFLQEEAECDAASGVYQGNFVTCAPNPCPQPTGACCSPGTSCEVLTEAECNAGSGLYQGDDTACSPNPCTALDGACCGPFGGCTIASFDECDAASGEFLGIGAACDPDPCPEIVGACCFEDGTCTLDTAAQCAGQGGAYEGDAIACTPNPCPQPPACQLSTTTLDFGEVFLGESEEQSFTLTNSGGSLLEGAISVACAGFELVGSGEYSLGASESRQFTIRFAPIAVGDAQCAIETGSLLCDLVVAGGTGTDAPPEPICEVSDAFLNFGSVAIDGSRMLSFVITNVGDGVLSGAVEAGCGDFHVLGDTGYELGADESRTFDIVFEPARLGVHSCQLLTGTGCAPIQLTGESVNVVECDVFPASLEFGDVRVGELAEREFTVSNASLVRITGSVTLAPGCTDFFLVGEVGYSLDPGESKTFRVRFEPSGGGSRTCSANAGLAACAPVSLHGTGVPPVCALPETQIDFGPVPLGGSVTRSFVVRNTGGGDLIGAATTDCAAVQVTGSPSFALETDQETSIEITFTPLELGAVSCSIDLEHPTCSAISAVGEGVEPARCVLSTDELDFGDVVVGETAQLDFTLRNDGGAPLRGTFAPRSSCGSVVVFDGASVFDLASGESERFTVSFTPQVLGSFECAIDMETESVDPCTGLRILGAGVAPPAPECELSVELLSFPNTVAGEMSEEAITLTNTGNLSLTAQISTSCDAFTIVGDGTVDVAPEASVEIIVRFQPEEAGSFECSLLIDGVACDLVGLRGTAVPPPAAACALEPAIVQLGEMEVGLSVQRQIFLTNIGTAPLAGTLRSDCGGLAIVGDATYDIAPNETQSFIVEYTAPEAGNISCALFIEGGTCAEWPVVGIAQPAGTPVCTVDPPLVDFGFVALGATADRRLTLRNTGGGSLAGTLETGCASMTIEEGEPGFELRAGESQSWVLRFTPSVMGDETCAASFGAESCAVPLVGTGSARTLTRTVEQPLEMVSWGVQLGSATVGDVFGGLGISGRDFELSRWSPPDSAYATVEGQLDPEPAAALWLQRQSASGEWSYEGDPEDGVYTARLGGAGGQRPTWHQLGNPYQRTLSIDHLSVNDGTGWIPFTSASNRITEPVLWVWNGDRYESAETIEPLGGFFLRKLHDREITLRFDPLHETAIARESSTGSPSQGESHLGGLGAGIDWLIRCTAGPG